MPELEVVREVLGRRVVGQTLSEVLPLDGHPIPYSSDEKGVIICCRADMARRLVHPPLGNVLNSW